MWQNQLFLLLYIWKFFQEKASYKDCSWVSSAYHCSQRLCWGESWSLDTHIHVCSVTQPCLTLQSQGLQPARVLCPWNSPGKNTGGGCHALFQGIFSIQGLNLHLLHLLRCRRILLLSRHQGSPGPGMHKLFKSIFPRFCDSLQEVAVVRKGQEIGRWLRN